MKPVCIIIPVYNCSKWLKICLEHLYSSTDYPFILLLIESESTDGSAKFCDDFAIQHHNVKVIHSKREGLVKAINIGLKNSADMDVYLTQADVIHRRFYAIDWLGYLAKESERFGAIVTLGAGGFSGKDYIDGLRWFGTWSVYLTRETINKVGLLDERFGPGDDIDYTYRCYKEGIKIGEAPFWVEHHRLTEHYGDDPELARRMGEQFRKKWGLSEYATS